MAGDWIKMRTRLEGTIEATQIASALNLTMEETISLLYRVACWFHEQGKYGVVEAYPRIIDLLLQRDGFADALLDVDWLRHENGSLMLRGFCTVSAIRKSLGKAIRQEVLSTGICAACGASESLQVDHIIPVCRGGRSDLSNLQALCRTCNARKGTKTMEEFTNG